jgi:hypothetical protein
MLPGCSTLAQLSEPLIGSMSCRRRPDKRRPADGSSSFCCQPQAVEEDAEEGALEEGEAQVAEKQLAGPEANLPQLAATAEWLCRGALVR